MKQYKATVRVSGVWVNTIVFAENSNHAFQLAKAQYGATHVLVPPQQIGH